jgi:hypothetical protein
MAITIQDQPSTTYVRPAFAPIEYLLTSTNTAQTGFKIICKVYFDPTGANTLISTQQISIKPLTIQAIFSVQDVVKSYVPIKKRQLQRQLDYTSERGLHYYLILICHSQAERLHFQYNLFTE